MSPAPLKRSEQWKEFLEMWRKVRADTRALQREKQKKFKVKTKFTNLLDFS